MQVAEGLNWLHVPWTDGVAPKGRLRNSVKNPPCNGWQHAFVFAGEKRATIVCPYSLRAFDVASDCDELTRAVEPKQGFREDVVVGIMQRNWAEHQARGWQSDYDQVAQVFTALGREVPEQVQKGGETDMKRKGGKPAEPFLTKPVKTNGKRGKFLKWFADNDWQGSVRTAMAEFDMTRSNALSYLHILWRDHGIGYELVGDTVTVELPDLEEWPFDTPRPEPEQSDDTEDDSWLD